KPHPPARARRGLRGLRAEGGYRVRGPPAEDPVLGPALRARGRGLGERSSAATLSDRSRSVSALAAVRVDGPAPRAGATLALPAAPSAARESFGWTLPQWVGSPRSWPPPPRRGSLSRLGVRCCRGLWPTTVAPGGPGP